MAIAKTTPAARKQRTVARQDASPRYLVLEESYIDGALVGPNHQIKEVTYWGVPGKHLQPLNALAKANKNAALEIRRATYEGATPEERAATKAEELRALDNDLQGIQAVDDWEAAEDEPLSDSERAELERHVQATRKAEDEAQQDDTNRVPIKLQGNPALYEDNTTLQGATPVLDGKGKSGK